MPRSDLSSDLIEFSKDQLAIMNDVLVAILHAKTLDNLFPEICEALKRLSSFYGCGLYKVSDKKLGLHLFRAVGDYLIYLPDLIPQGSDLYKSIASETPISSEVKENKHDCKQMSLFEEVPILSFCPIFVDNEMVGALAAIHGPELSSFINSVLQQISHALELICKAHGKIIQSFLPEANEKSEDASKSNICDKLTAREKEILSLMAEGLSTKEMAMRLYISSATCKNHIQNILGKLGVRSRAAAVAVGLAHLKRKRS